MSREEISRISVPEIIETSEIFVIRENKKSSKNNSISESLSLSNAIFLIAASTAIGVIVLLLVYKKLQQSN